MFKKILPNVLSFDIEWIPDPEAAARLCGVKLDGPASTHEAFKALWAEAGATPETPRPYLKTMLCRILTIVGVLREDKGKGDVSLKLVSLPSDVKDPEKCAESVIIDLFLRGIGRRRPQLVGYNSANADVPILMQRAVVHGLSGHGFGTRPDKPWEGPDYFSTASDFHVDLANALAWGRNTPRLHEAATLSGIPGKVDTAGDHVWEMFLNGQLDKILAYNEFDAITTHLLWARMAHFGDLLSPAQYEQEQKLVRELMESEIAAGKTHFTRYIEAWDALRRRS